MPKSVREPIQVYLTEQEREQLDQVASELGISRSEALRRGVMALDRRSTAGSLADLARDDVVTPASAGPGDPPPSLPVACASQILAELDEDRGER